MGRRRKIIQGDFTPKSNGDDMLDCVVLGTKPIYVEQVNGVWPPYAEVISSRVINRDPARQDEDGRLIWALRMAARPQIAPVRPGEKYCGRCGEWRTVSRFSADTRNRDGLQSQCKFCHAEHERKMYWARKQGVAQKAA